MTIKKNKKKTKTSELFLSGSPGPLTKIPGSAHVDTQMVFPKDFFLKKLIKISADDKIAWKITQ